MNATFDTSSIIMLRWFSFFFLKSASSPTACATLLLFMWLVMNSFSTFPLKLLFIRMLSSRDSESLSDFVYSNSDG